MAKQPLIAGMNPNDPGSISPTSFLQFMLSPGRGTAEAARSAEGFAGNAVGVDLSGRGSAYRSVTEQDPLSFSDFYGAMRQGRPINTQGEDLPKPGSALAKAQARLAMEALDNTEFGRRLRASPQGTSPDVASQTALEQWASGDKSAMGEFVSALMPNVYNPIMNAARGDWPGLVAMGKMAGDLAPGPAELTAAVKTLPFIKPALLPVTKAAAKGGAMLADAAAPAVSALTSSPLAKALGLGVQKAALPAAAGGAAVGMLRHEMTAARNAPYPHERGDYRDQMNQGPGAYQRGAIDLGDGPPKPPPRLGEGTGEPFPGTVTPGRGGVTRFPAGVRQRTAYPGIYGDPRSIIQDVNVVPESPNLSRLFGTTRAELSQDALGRGSSLPDWIPAATPANPKGSAAARSIMTRGNENRIKSILDESRSRPDLFTGMTGWYNMDPMYQHMVQLMGPEEATRRYLQQQGLQSLASPGSDVITEINRGSRADWLAERGRFDEFVDQGGYPNKLQMQPGWNRPRTAFGLDPEMQGMPGHAYHSTSQGPPMKRYLESEFTELGKSAKVPAYTVAGRPHAIGNQQHYPVGDAHWARGVGLADVRTNKGYPQSASLPEMTTLAPWYRELAEDVGLQGVPAQALQWGVLSRQTGVQTPVGQPKLEITADQIVETAYRLGISPEKARDMYLLGDLPIGYAGGAR